MLESGMRLYRAAPGCTDLVRRGSRPREPVRARCSLHAKTAVIRSRGSLRRVVQREPALDLSQWRDGVDRAQSAPGKSGGRRHRNVPAAREQLGGRRTGGWCPAVDWFRWSHDHEPATGFWRRVKAALIGLLPIEKYYCTAVSTGTKAGRECRRAVEAGYNARYAIRRPVCHRRCQPAPAGRSHAPLHPRRLYRPGAPVGRGQAVAACDRERPSALDDLLGSAGHRQDDAGAPAGRQFRLCISHAVCRAGRGQGYPRGRGAGEADARPDRSRHRVVHRRGAPFQQEPAGCLPAACRGRHLSVRRRDHREPLVRTQQCAAVARPGLRTQVAGD